jgi:hypothetical protein
MRSALSYIEDFDDWSLMVMNYLQNELEDYEKMLPKKGLTQQAFDLIKRVFEHAKFVIVHLETRCKHSGQDFATSWRAKLWLFFRRLFRRTKSLSERDCEELRRRLWRTEQGCIGLRSRFPKVFEEIDIESTVRSITQALTDKNCTFEKVEKVSRKRLKSKRQHELPAKQSLVKKTLKPKRQITNALMERDYERELALYKLLARRASAQKSSLCS